MAAYHRQGVLKLYKGELIRGGLIKKNGGA